MTHLKGVALLLLALIAAPSASGRLLQQKCVAAGLLCTHRPCTRSCEQEKMLQIGL